MINLSCRNYNLIIDGLNCTTALTEINGNYDHYQSGTGYVKISANLTLKRPAYDWTESLDHRTNSRWARGKEITFQIANENGILTACPVLGKLYILTASYDGNITLNLTAGCILSLLDFRAPSGDGVCFSIGNITSLNAIATSLLTEAGVPNFSVNLSGDGLKAPLPKLTNESYIQMFGKLCFANNYLAYQDRFGIVKVRKIETLNTVSLKELVCGQDELSYKPLTGNEQPAEIYKVSGIVKNVVNINDFLTQSASEIFGSYTNEENQTYDGLLERRTEYIDEINNGNRTVYGKTYIEQLAASLLPIWFPDWFRLISFQTTEKTNYFESATAINKCSDTDEGKLLTTIETITSPLVLVLNEFYTRLKRLTENDNTEFILIGKLNPITAKKTVINYEYQVQDTNLGILEESSINSRQLGFARKITTIWQPKGTLMYEALTDDQDHLYWKFYNPQTLVKSEVIEEVWRELSPNQWEYKLTRRQAAFLNQPTETVDKMLAWRDEGKEILSYNFFWELQTIEISRSVSYTANQPPSPERFPSSEIVIENQIVEIEKFPSYAGEYKEKIKEINIDAGFLTSNQQARNIAKLEAALAWGKFVGNSFTTALFDEFLDVSPLSPLSWQEPTGFIHKFLLDGISIAFESNQLAFSSDGIWVSQVISEGEGNDRIEYEIPINLAMGLPNIYLIKGRSNSKGQIYYYPYSLSSVEEYLLTGASSSNGTITMEILSSIDNVSIINNFFIVEN